MSKASARVLVFGWGTGPEGNERIIERLRRRAETEVFWVGYGPGTDLEVFDGFNLRFETPFSPELLKYEDLLGPDAYIEFLEIYSRHWRDHQKDYIDMRYAFRLYCRYWGALFEKFRPTHAVFCLIPHEGPEYLAYRMARALGIPTRIYMHTHQSERYYTLEQIEDYGRIPDRDLPPSETHTIERKFFQQLYSSQFVNRNLGWGFRKQRWIAWAKLLAKFALGRPGALQRFFEERRHEKFLASLPVPTRLPEKFVYFALHAQPEMTTSPLGGVYTDQALAVERLAAMLPPDVKIVVKENPVQSSFVRGEHFYRRLQAIPTVLLVSRQQSTYHLIEKSLFVATITGTVGWEALAGGKNVLHFGRAWYRDLPGAYQFRSDLDVSKLWTDTFSHDELEYRYSQLMSQTRRGTPDVSMIPGHENYIPADNVNEFYSQIDAFISTPPSAAPTRERSDT